MKNFNPNDVTITLTRKRNSEKHTLAGFADGTFVTCARLNDSFSDASGADGEVMRSKSNDLRGNVIFTLMQSSLSNSFLSAVAAVDEKDGKEIIAVEVKDINGEDIYNADEAWILKPSDAAFSKTPQNREWTIRCAELTMNSGGIANITDFGTA